MERDRDSSARRKGRSPEQTVVDEPLPTRLNCNSLDPVVIGLATITRDAPNGSPPWMAAHAVGITGFHVQPKRGEGISILPIGHRIGTIHMPIASGRLRDPVAEPVWWDVTVPPITAQSYLELPPAPLHSDAEPWDAIVLYPCVGEAHLLIPSALSTPAGDDFPGGTAQSNVKAVVEWDRDSNPDAVWLTVCCGDRTKRIERCPDEPHCNEIMVRPKGKKKGWRLLRRETPP